MQYDTQGDHFMNKTQKPYSSSQMAMNLAIHHGELKNVDT